jgi:hypothetical protein
VFTPASPIVGAAITGFTAPTYTLTADLAPDANGKQYAVTGLGGTQSGVVAHSVARPFTVTVTRPKVLRNLGTPNPVTNVVKQVPRNVYTVLTRKGVLPLAGQPATVMLIRTTIEVPSGADTADPANVDAALSAHFGVVWEQSNELADTAKNGVL